MPKVTVVDFGRSHVEPEWERYRASLTAQTDDGWHSWPERESQAERNPFIREYAKSLIEEELRKLIWDADKPKKRKRRRKRKKKPAAKTRIDEANEPRRMEL